MTRGFCRCLSAFKDSCLPARPFLLLVQSVRRPLETSPLTPQGHFIHPMAAAPTPHRIIYDLHSGIYLSSVPSIFTLVQTSEVLDASRSSPLPGALPLFFSVQNELFES